MLSAHGLTYRPAAGDSDLWPPLQFDTGGARLVLLSGRSGSGKSTLLRILCGLLPGFRGGRLSGEVSILGRPAPQRPDGRIGLLFQNTDAMLHSPRVVDELRARTRRLNGDGQQGRCRGWLAEVIEAFGLTGLLDRRIVELSGGERQRVALAAVFATRPAAVLLDEPTSNLDPQAACVFAELIRACADRFGTGFVVAEHRASHVLAAVDGAVNLDCAGGRSWWGARGSAPVDVRPQVPDLDGLRAFAAQHRAPGRGEPLLTGRGLSCRRGGRVVLDGVKLELRSGEIVGLTGPNGAGKSTLLLLLAGELRPAARGELLWHGNGQRRRTRPRVGLLLQNPLHQLFCDTVRAEVALAAENYCVAGMADQVDRLLAVADLTALASRATLSLSYGEQQRVALAGSMSGEPRVVLLDEPTHGMDGPRLGQIVRFIVAARCAGTAFVIASHDEALLRAFCDRILVLRDGRLQ